MTNLVRRPLLLLVLLSACVLLGHVATAEALVSAGGGFYFQSAQPFGWQISNVQFTTATDVWAVAHTQNNGVRLLHSSDAGATWESADPAYDPHHDEQLDDLTFVDATHARALQGWQTSATTYAIALVKSDDGGASWAMTPIGTNHWYPYGSCLPGKDDAVVYGRDYDAATRTYPRVMLASRDGGESWTRTVLPFEFGFELWTKDLTSYWAWNLDDGRDTKVYTSSDGGASWQARALPEGGYLVQQFTPVDALTAWALVLNVAGPPNTYQLLRTSDGGQSWDLARTLDVRKAVSLSVLGASRAYLAVSSQFGAFQAPNSLELTTDGGATWATVRAAGPVAISGIVEGPGGTLLTKDLWRSADAGATWERLAPDRHDYMLEGVTATAAGRLFAVGTTTPWAPGIYDPTGGSGIILRSTDGARWKQVKIAAGASLRAVDFYGDRYGWAAGSSGRALRTTDGGVSWRPVRKVGSNFVVLGIEATGEDSAVAVVTQISNDTTHHGIARTSDGGRSWKLSHWTATEAYTSISPAGKGRLVVAGLHWGKQRQAIALASSDGGATWKRILQRDCDWEVRDVAFTDAQHGCLLASDSADWNGSYGTEVLRTANGGRTWTAVDLGTVSTLSLTSLTFATAKTGWAVGDRILKTTDGGATWTDTGAAVPYAGTSTVSEAALFGVAASQGSVWAVGAGQLILSTKDASGDTAAPVTSDDGDRLWHSSAVTTHLSAVDVAGSVMSTQYRVDGGSWKAYAAGVTVAAKADHSADGEHRVEYRSTDNAGHVEFPQLCVARIDTRKPKTVAYGEVTVTSGAKARIGYQVTDASPCAGTATVTITVRDAAGAVVDSLALGEQSTGKRLTATYVCSLAAGSYTYRVTATDAAGNPQSQSGSGALTVE